MASPVSTDNSPRRPRSWIRFIHPLLAVPVFIFVTQKAGEKYYPLSNFPMYSNPSDWDDYVYLTDAEDKVLPIQWHTGLSCARLGKIFNTTMKKHGLKQSAVKRNAPPDVEAQVGQAVLADARSMAEKRQRPLPEKVRIHRVIIERQEDGRITERTHLVTEG